MTRLELMELAEDCSDVLTAMEDDLLNNIAEYLSEGRADIPTAQWKIQQLAALGKLDKANIRTIAEYSDIAADMEEIAMTRAALAAVKEMDEGFAKLARDGIISGTDVPMEESTLQAAAMYSKQAKDRLNKVNTVMRYFAKSAAAAAINRTAEIVDKQQHLNLLNKAAGKVIMGAESRQSAVRQCIKEMSARGIPAFVDAAGRQWSPEAYINMDVRTTCSNTAHEAQFTRMDDYDIDLLEVSSHAGARPKCSKDQGRIFSRSGKSKKYPAWKTSSYGEPDGILGINCGHQIYPYVEGVSVQRYFPYGQEENDELYKKKQEQRRLEREVRGAKREVSMLNAAGDKEGAALAKERVKSKTAAYDKYCEKTGLPRKADRLTVEGYRTKAAEEKKALKGLDNGGGSGILNIDIDEFVPCLKDAKTGEILETEVQLMRRNDLSKYNTKTGWGDNWSKRPKDEKVYGVFIKGDSEPQGLISLRNDKGGTYIGFASTAPHNNKQIVGDNQKYLGVGGHLFALAVEDSLENGGQGTIYGYAVNRQVLDHYISKFGAIHLPYSHEYQFIIEGEASKKLLDMYNYERR